ncbi:MAG: S41 family peptidase [Bacteroidia bacterium]
MQQKSNWNLFTYSALIALGILIGIIFKPSESVIQFVGGGKNKITEILSIIKQSYVDEVDIDSLEESSISNLLTTLDPHSVYISAKDLAMANEQLEGNFEGIGVEFNILNDTIMVVSALSGGPSYELGIQPGDRIVSVDTMNVAGIGITNEKVFKLLRGPKGSVVNVGIYRPSVNTIIPFKITRNTIPIFSVEAWFMLEPKTGYIKISRFAEHTHEEFLKAFKELEKEGLENLVLDLRGNPGGYLNTATQIVDEFLSDGKLIVYTQGRTKPRSESKAQNKGVFENGKLIVLIDEGSASASEIVSGAIQDWDRGLVVGRRSFGKGLVQEPYELKDGSAIRLTVSRYYTPSGRCIQKEYKNGKDYDHDILERYETGEMEDENKAHIFDSTPYFTKVLLRKVYGGGGIYPDVFVPVDTSYISKFLTQVISKSLISKFAYNYLDKNREFINQNYNLNSFTNTFQLTNEDLNKFVQFVSENDVDISNKQAIDKSIGFIKLQIKALMARQLFRDKGYYMVMQQNDNAIKTAVKALNNYQNILKK